MRRNPHLYEINTRLFLGRMSEKYGKRLTIAAIPEETWQEISRCGFDLVWLMGVWRRSPASRRKTRLDPSLRQGYDEALPGWSDGDIDGSPYAVREYSLDPSLGGASELAELKARLNRHDLGLVLDFVSNHLAIDHPWTVTHPERFVGGGEAAVRAHPDWFFSPKKGSYLAYGRDPNFPPWTDTAQLNFYSSDLRQALIRELLRVAGAADGVRCDMAMLALADVFRRTWGEITGGPGPSAEFWAEAIRQVRQKIPGFLCLAEVYWGLERELQGLGFDFTYNKDLYDALRFASPSEIRRLLADASSLARSVNFIENHDEKRAVTAFGRERSLAAAIVIATIPGLRLFHDGQLEGCRIRLPVQMVRGPEETPDAGIMAFYRRLLAIANRPVFHDGEWQLLELTRAWEGNESHQNLLAWSWRYAGEAMIVVVNYSAHPAQGRLKVMLPEVEIAGLSFLDELTGVTYKRDSAEVRNEGLYIALEPYQSHIFKMTIE
jgi:glycosidase